MELLNTAVNAAVVVAVGLLVGRYLKGRFEEIDRRFEQVDQRFEQNERRWEVADRRFAVIEAKLEAHDARFDTIDARMESFERSVDGMRSDLTRVALAVGASPSAEAGG